MPNENLYGLVDRIKTLYLEERKKLLTENEYLKARIAELEAQLQWANDQVNLAEDQNAKLQVELSHQAEISRIRKMHAAGSNPELTWSDQP